MRGRVSMYVCERESECMRRVCVGHRNGHSQHLRGEDRGGAEHQRIATADAEHCSKCVCVCGCNETKNIQLGLKYPNKSIWDTI